MLQTRFHQSRHTTRVGFISSYFLVVVRTSSPLLFSADLVPVFSFGENDVSLQWLYFRTILNDAHEQIYKQMSNEKGTTVYALQKKFQSVFGFTLPLFHGRGLLNCRWILPASHSIYKCMR